MRKRGFTAVEAVIVIVVLAIVVGVTMVQVDKRRQARLREELLALRDILQFDGRFPMLSRETGHLAPSAEYLDGFIEGKTRTRGNTSDTVQFAPSLKGRDVWLALTDDRYWYIGYALPSEKVGLAFVGLTRRLLRKPGSHPAGILETPHLAPQCPFLPFRDFGKTVARFLQPPSETRV